MQTSTLSGGFTTPAVQSSNAFRAIMEAMARPGTIQSVTGSMPPGPLSPAAGAVLLTLCDTDTPVRLAGAFACHEVQEWLAFHTGAPIVERAFAMFAVGSWEDLTPISGYPIGTPEYPDRSATLIVETSHIEAEGATLTGPGIKDQASLTLPETPAFQSNSALFPLGLDFIFTHGDRLAALPRTTQVS